MAPNNSAPSSPPCAPAASWWPGEHCASHADMDGARYSIVQATELVGGPWCVYRDGLEIAGPDIVGAPAGFRSESAAQRWAELHAAGVVS